MARSIRSRPLHLLLVLALAASPSFAAVRRQAPVRAAKTATSVSWVSRTWSALQSLFGHLGAEMDPDGAKAATPTTAPTTSTVQPPPSSDSGAEMDPDG